MRKDEFPLIEAYADSKVNEVLDKIRAEIEARLCDVVSDYTDGYRTAIQGNLAILDKYKAETEVKDGNDD